MWLLRINNEVQHFRILRSPDRHQYFLWNNSPHFDTVNLLINHYRHVPVSKNGSSVLRDISWVSTDIRIITKLLFINHFYRLQQKVAPAQNC